MSTLIRAKDKIRDELAAISGASLVKANAYQNQDSINKERPSVKRYGAVDDAIVSYNAPASDTISGTDSTSAFRAMAAACDAGSAYWYAPAFNGDYLITDTITFTQPGVRLFGDNGARALTRETPRRKGNIYLQRGMTRGFDLGGSRTTGNPADNWTLDGLSIMAIYADATCDGFVFTSKTNGPDRGITIRNCSGTYLKSAIAFPSRETQTAAATLVVENCTFIGNDYALTALNGNVLGARIVGNQLEQNTLGGIRGAFNGPVYIADNMLEGQPNAISLEYPEVILGNLCDAVIERNYFESNTGDYSIRLAAGSRCALTVKNNYWAPNFPTDKILLVGHATVRLTVDEEIWSQVYVTMSEFDGVVNYGSRFLNNRSSMFQVRKLNPLMSPLVITADYENFTEDGVNIDSPETGLIHHNTPYGNMLCADFGEYVYIPLNVNTGDIFSINIFCRIDQGAFFSFNLQNLAKNSNLQVWSLYSADSIDCNGRWALVTIPIIANQTTSGMWFKTNALAGSVGSFLIAGIAATNYGAFVNDGSAVKQIRPLMPNRVVNQIGSNYNQTSAVGGTSIIDTGIQVASAYSGQDFVLAYDLIATGKTNAGVTQETAVAHGVLTVIYTGTTYSVAYTSQGVVSGANPIAITAVFWDGVTESATTTNTLSQIRIKIAGYVSNTGYQQLCKLVRRI